MEIIFLFLLGVFLLFIIVYCATKLAVKLLLENSKEREIRYKQELDLMKLKDFDVLSNAELEEVMELYEKKGLEVGHYEKYTKYSNVLKDLKEIGYLNDEEYLVRKMKLKEYFKIN